MTFPAPPAGLRGTLVEHVPCEVVTFDLGAAPPGATYRGFPTLPGPKAAASNTSPFLTALIFGITGSGVSFDGYWQWCCNTGQSTVGLNYALWLRTGSATGVNIPAGTVTGGLLTVGAWNFVPVPAPIPLNNGSTYYAVNETTFGFPFQQNFWGAGDIGHAGVTNGPLNIYSDAGADNPPPQFDVQQGFNASGATDPSTTLPVGPSSSFTSWLDVQVSTG